MTTETEITLCPTCSGKGVKEHRELADYHRGEYGRWTTKCDICEGTGMVTVTTTTTITPHKPQRPTK